MGNTTRRRLYCLKYDHRPACHGPQPFVIGLMLLLFIGWHANVPAQSLWTEKSTATPAPIALQQLNASLQQLAASLLPAVVSLKVHTKKDDTEVSQNPPQLPNHPNQVATGSGFIIRADGLILTNDHVVEDEVRIEVYFYSGEVTTAKVVGRDPLGDLALLRVQADRPLPVAPLGRSARIEVGEFVMAIGSPFGFEHTMTFGVVSGMKRQFMRSGIVGGYIQTDASINTGNSGGPLVNMRGEVVGMNTATVGRGELGFAIPIDAIKAILPQLHGSGEVRRGWLGVQIRPLNGPQARERGITASHGVYVHDVLNDHPAHRAGIIAGDVIVRFDGLRIVTPLDLQSAVAGTPVGKTVRVQLLRKQAVRSLQLTVGEMPARQ